jgi:hypothetical protein
VIGTLGSHSSTPSSATATTPSASAKFVALSKRLFSFHRSAFFGGLPFALSVIQYGVL